MKLPSDPWNYQRKSGKHRYSSSQNFQRKLFIELTQKDLNLTHWTGKNDKNCN